MTREELEKLLAKREAENIELNKTIAEMNNAMYLAEGKKFGEGYQKAMENILDVLVDIFGKEKKE